MNSPIKVAITGAAGQIGYALVFRVASGAMFRAGVLLNSGDAIERLAEVDRIIFDKTGTLTLPELDVVNSASIPPDMFELAGRLALASHHPVAAAAAAPALPVASTSDRPSLHYGVSEPVQLRTACANCARAGQ